MQLHKACKRSLLVLLTACALPTLSMAQQAPEDQLLRLIKMPLKNIFVEYPNKTSHNILDSLDARLTPRDLHPAFYGSFDWRASNGYVRSCASRRSHRKLGAGHVE